MTWPLVFWYISANKWNKPGTFPNRRCVGIEFGSKQTAPTNPGEGVLRSVCYTPRGENRKALWQDRNGYSGISLARIYIWGISPPQFDHFFCANIVPRPTVPAADSVQCSPMNTDTKFRD